MSSDTEKLPLLDIDSTPPSRQSRKRSLLRCLVPTLALFGFVAIQIAATTSGYDPAPASRCDQVDPYVPEPNDSLDRNRDVIFSSKFREESARVLSGFVQVRSPSFDDLGKVGEDERWDVFYEVSKYLNRTFPEVYQTLSVEKVNTHAHVLTWQGSDSSLKPTLLAGHLDVVPVEPATLNRWTHPPFEGHYDGEYLWGRGSVDDKHAVAAILESVTLLIKKGFFPRRTLVLAFGFDEESKGREGAGHIQKHLEAKYGKDGVAVIVDEGGLGVGEQFGANMAIVATGEKGYVDVKFTLTTPGGHSSIPPDHTSIGIISQLVTSLEANPFEPSLPLDSPVLLLLSCAAEYGQLPNSLKRDVKRGTTSGKKGDQARLKAAKEFSSMGKGPRYLVSTSQALDVIKGGVKVNALPESVEVVANYRVAIGSEIQDVKDHVTKLVHSLADQFDLSVDLFGSKRSSHAQVGSNKLGFAMSGEAGSAGNLKVVAINELPVAPVSLTTGSKAWDILSGTIKHTLNRSKGDLIVSPAVMTGNTDTRYYWALSQQIYRFTPMNREKSLYLHTVDERLWFNDHVDAIWFFHELVRSYDEAEL